MLEGKGGSRGQQRATVTIQTRDEGTGAGMGNGHGEKCSVYESVLKVGPTA